MHYPIAEKFLAEKRINIIQLCTKNRADISKRSKVIPFLICTYTTTPTEQGVEL